VNNPITRRVFLISAIALIGMQFVPTEPHEKSVVTTTGSVTDGIDRQVEAILDHSCRDCHSANTRWPWYSKVAPVSWIVARDVRRGRAKLDFSTWAGRNHSSNERMEICDAVSNGTMPMRAYTLIHHEALLSSEDVDHICAWADSSNQPSGVAVQDRNTASAASGANPKPNQEGER
jgi:hypothetical protein